MWFDATFAMVDGLDFASARHVRLEEHVQGELTRGFANSPKYQHLPGSVWRCINTPRSMNDDLEPDLYLRWPHLRVGEVYADTTHDPPELIQIISLSGF